MREFKKISTILGLILLLPLQSAIADDDSVKVRGTYMVSFMHFDFIGDSGGNAFFDVGLQGSFSLEVGNSMRNGTIAFPHILHFPPDPANEAGSISGAAVWIFEDGVFCLGSLAGPIDADGFRGKGKFACSDGTRLVLKVKDQEVIPGVSITASLKGKLITDDD